MRHTRHGWWLEEAGSVVPDPAARGGRDRGRRHRRRRLPRALDGLAAPRARAGRRCRRARGGRLRARAERTERRLLRDALERRGHAPGGVRRWGPRSPCAAHRRTPCAGSARGAGRTTSTPGTARRRCSRSRRRESQLGSWDAEVRACAELGAPDEIVTLSAEAVARALRVAALQGSGALPAQRERCSPPGLRSACADGCSSEACGSTSGPRCVKLADDGVETRRRPRAGRLGRARGERADDPVSGLPALARSRLEPHRPHRAGAGRARRARLDGRRGDRGQPHARPLHADDAWTGASPSAGAVGRWASAAGPRTGSTSTAM